jgi:hypothetical protein
LAIADRTFKGYRPFELSVNYNIQVFRTLRLWPKVDVYNLLGSDKLIAWNTTVGPDPKRPKHNLGLPRRFARASMFGTATGHTINLTGLNRQRVSDGTRRRAARLANAAGRIRIAFLIRAHGACHLVPGPRS